jgi:hypothetical protein
MKAIGGWKPKSTYERKMTYEKHYYEKGFCQEKIITRRRLTCYFGCNARNIHLTRHYQKVDGLRLFFY